MRLPKIKIINCKGFSLLELIVSISIISITSSFVVPYSLTWLRKEKVNAYTRELSEFFRLIRLEARRWGSSCFIYTNSFDSSNKGVGFAIPSNMVKQVMDDLVAYGKVVRSWIGVQIQALDESKAKALGLDSRNGALVADVVGDGPADKAGIETGDVIVEFNSQKVKTVDNLRNKVSASKPNKSYELILIRDGKKKTMRVKLEEMPSDEVLIGSNVEESSNEIGIKVSSISRSLRNQYNLNAKDEGVVVVSVDENSPSDVAGIQPGDIITRVGTKKCTNPEQFQRLLNDTKKRNMVMLHLKRDGAARYLTLEVD